jgi:Protein of unknown function (DUF1552)
MNDKSAFLSRRTFLRGSGIALALPWFESMAIGGPGFNETPKRFVSIYHPDGVGLPLKSDPAWEDWSWFPQGGEKDFRLTKVLEVLEPLRSDITIYSGLSHPDSRTVHGHSNADQYLTGAPIGGHGPYRNTISLDQVYAEHAGDFTRHSSLVMSTNGGVGGPRGAQTQSFNREGRPIPAMNKPKEIFDMLFVTSGKDAAARLARSKSALDLLIDNTLKQYLDAVRDIRLKNSVVLHRDSRTPPSRPVRATCWTIRWPCTAPHRAASTSRATIRSFPLAEGISASPTDGT